MHKIKLSLLVLLFNLKVHAQLFTYFEFGGLQFSSSSGPAFTSPILLSKDSGCLRVSNGIVIFNASAAGYSLFSQICPDLTNTINVKFKLLPNPAPGGTRIFLSGNIASSDKIELFLHDVSGRLLQLRSLTASDFYRGYQINLSEFPSGFFIVSLLHNGRMHNLKLINTLY